MGIFQQIENRKSARRLVLVGCVLLLGIYTMKWVVVPALIHWQISTNFRLESGGEVWEEWSDVKANILVKVYIFNVTNHEDVLKGEIPKLVELGPYVYQQKRTKEIVKEDVEKGTFTYRPTVNHTFRPDLSNGTESDRVVILNVPLMAAINMMSRFHSMLQNMVKFYIDSFEEPPFIESDVGTVLFKGIHIPMVESVSGLIGKDLLPNNTFAFFNERNGTLDDLEVGSNHTNLGITYSWRGKPAMDIWDGEFCNMINGTDGTLYPSYISKDSVLHAFEPEICRSVQMEFDKEDDYHGISVYKFSVPSKVYSEEYSLNQCYCPEEDKSLCPKSGAVSLSVCKNDAPLVFSKPYFMDAEDPSYAEPFQSIMKPNASIHNSFILIEPTTGVVLEIHRRLQFSLHLKPSKTFDTFANVPDVVVPTFWMDEEAYQPEEIQWKLKLRFLIPMAVWNYGKLALYFFSSIFIAVGIFLLMKPERKNEKNHNLQFESPEQAKFLRNT